MVVASFYDKKVSEKKFESGKVFCSHENCCNLWLQNQRNQWNCFKSMLQSCIKKAFKGKFTEWRENNGWWQERKSSFLLNFLPFIVQKRKINIVSELKKVEQTK